MTRSSVRTETAWISLLCVSLDDHSARVDAGLSRSRTFFTAIGQSFL
jgi:hypothetical protein